MCPTVRWMFSPQVEEDRDTEQFRLRNIARIQKRVLTCAYPRTAADPGKRAEYLRYGHEDGPAAAAAANGNGRSARPPCHPPLSVGPRFSHIHAPILRNQTAACTFGALLSSTGGPLSLFLLTQLCESCAPSLSLSSSPLAAPGRRQQHYYEQEINPEDIFQAFFGGGFGGGPFGPQVRMHRHVRPRKATDSSPRCRYSPAAAELYGPARDCTAAPHPTPGVERVSGWLHSIHPPGLTSVER